MYRPILSSNSTLVTNRQTRYKHMNKNILKPSLLALALLSVGLVACDKADERIVVATPTLTTPTASGEAVSITAEALRSNAPVLTLSWAKASYSSDLVAPVYEVLASPEGREAEAQVFPVNTGQLSLDLTAKQINELILETFRLPADVATPINFWLRTYPTGSVDKTTAPLAQSSPIKLSLTALQLEEPIIKPEEYIATPYYFLGNMFEDAYSWKNDYAGYPLFKDSPTSPSYVYTGYFKAGSEFKFTNDQALGTWDNILGTKAEGTLTLEGGDTNIKAAGAGGYFALTMNPTAKTYSLVAKADVATESPYKQIGLIGTAVGGWDADKFVLKQTSYDKHLWVAKRVSVVAGEFKFRANGTWDTSWGGKQDLFPASKLTGGDNIEVTSKQAGTYDVYFCDLTQHYIFVPTRK